MNTIVDRVRNKLSVRSVVYRIYRTFLFIALYNCTLLVQVILHEFGHALGVVILLQQMVSITIKLEPMLGLPMPFLPLSGFTTAEQQVINIPYLIMIALGALTPLVIYILIRLMLKSRTSSKLWSEFAISLSVSSLIDNWWPQPTNDGTLMVQIIALIQRINYIPILDSLALLTPIYYIISFFAGLFTILFCYRLVFPHSRLRKGDNNQDNQNSYSIKDRIRSFISTLWRVILEPFVWFLVLLSIFLLIPITSNQVFILISIITIGTIIVHFTKIDLISK